MSSHNANKSWRPFCEKVLCLTPTNKEWTLRMNKNTYQHRGRAAMLRGPVSTTPTTTMTAAVTHFGRSFFSCTAENQIANQNSWDNICLWRRLARFEDLFRVFWICWQTAEITKPKRSLPNFRSECFASKHVIISSGCQGHKSVTLFLWQKKINNKSA